MSIIVMVCFARSGGTVLNQCLGCLPDVVMLSEVNPLGAGSGKGPISYRTVKEQAKYWYNINISSDDFVEGILELAEICENTGKRLVIRDWSYINFISNDLKNFPPPNRLLTLEYLEKKCKIIPFSFVRDAIDVWLSIGRPSIEIFFECYLNYVNEVFRRRIPVFKYEDFCISPSNVIYNICEYTGLEYNESFWNYSKYEKVNGDIQIKGGSRGIRQNKIKQLPRKIIFKKATISKLNYCEYMIKCNDFLGYPVSYYDRPKEKIVSKIFSVAQRKILEYIEERQY